MKFMLLCYDDEAAWKELGDAAHRAAIKEAVALTHELHAKGQYQLASPLESVATAKSVRIRDGKTLVTDGPFAETREQLGGFYLIEAKDQAEAVAIAARHPGARLGTVEVRPIMEIDGLPEPQKLPRPRKIFVNLPVKDLNRSIEFFTKLGFTFNPQFTDETATCMIVATDIFVMLLTEAKFKEFTPKAIADATKTSEVLTCLSCEDRAEVDKFVAAAKTAGGSTFTDAKDYGFMYQHSFQDPDGHIWELVWMDPQFVPPQQS